MTDTLSQLEILLTDVILPNLKGISACQVEQRMEGDRLARMIEDFRSEIQISFAQLRAEIAACRQEVEDAAILLRDGEAASPAEPAVKGRKTLIH
jgi:hypothetical protein